MENFKMFFLKFKKIKRILKKKRKEDFIINYLKNYIEIKSIKFQNKKTYEIELNNSLKINIRNEKHSDYLVFKQIFITKEYELIRSILSINNFSNLNIIDAGANIGLTSLFFFKDFPNTNFFCIEPDKSNLEIALNNFNNNNIKNYKIYNKALTEDSKKSYSIDRSFRDGLDWAISVYEDSSGIIESITINDIIIENNLTEISFLKIDIEGAERFLFEKEDNLTFLKVTKIISIEIHDEFNDRNKIIELIKKNNFLVFETGEITIGINKIFI